MLARKSLTCATSISLLAAGAYQTCSAGLLGLLLGEVFPAAFFLAIRFAVSRWYKDLPTPAPYNLRAQCRTTCESVPDDWLCTNEVESDT